MERSFIKKKKNLTTFLIEGLNIMFFLGLLNFDTGEKRTGYAISELGSKY